LLSTAAIRRVPSDRLGQLPGEGEIDAVGREERRPDDGVRGTPGEHVTRAADRPDAAAHAAGQRLRDARHEVVVVPLPLGRVEVDELDLRPSREPGDPGVDVVALDRETFTLHELDDAAAKEVDGGYQHGECLESTPNAQLPIPKTGCSNHAGGSRVKAVTRHDFRQPSRAAPLGRELGVGSCDGFLMV
jgi:hypothetical protein